MTTLALVAAALLAAQSADERHPQLEALARTLGEAHQLRRICEPDDEPDLFRARMARLIELEKTSEGDPLIRAFNAGFDEARRRHRDCDGAARRARREVADRGEALVIAVADGLAQPPAGLAFAENERVSAMLAAAQEGEDGAIAEAPPVDATHTAN